MVLLLPKATSVSERRICLQCGCISPSPLFLSGRLSQRQRRTLLETFLPTVFFPRSQTLFFLFSPLFSYFFRSGKTSSKPPLGSHPTLKQKFPRVYGRKQSNLFASPPCPLNPFSGLVFLSSIPFWGFLVLFPIAQGSVFEILQQFRKGTLPINSCRISPAFLQMFQS